METDPEMEQILKLAGKVFTIVFIIMIGKHANDEVKKTQQRVRNYNKEPNGNSVIKYTISEIMLVIETLRDAENEILALILSINTKSL